MAFQKAQLVHVLNCYVQAMCLPLHQVAIVFHVTYHILLLNELKCENAECVKHQMEMYISLLKV